MGTMKREYGNLKNLRGTRAAEARDRRVLAETSILESVKDKQVRTDIHVPKVLPEDVAKLMTENELENATIVFGHKAVELFSYVFGQSMQAAVESAMQGMEKTIENIIDRKMIELMGYASASIENILALTKNVELPDKLVSFTDEAIEAKEDTQDEDSAPEVLLVSADYSGLKPRLNRKYMGRGELKPLILSKMSETTPKTAIQIAEELEVEYKDVNRRTINSAIHYMLSRGQVYKVRHGEYVKVVTGEDSKD